MPLFRPNAFSVARHKIAKHLQHLINIEKGDWETMILSFFLLADSFFSFPFAVNVRMFGIIPVSVC